MGQTHSHQTCKLCQGVKFQSSRGPEVHSFKNKGIKLAFLENPAGNLLRGWGMVNSALKFKVLQTFKDSCQGRKADCCHWLKSIHGPVHKWVQNTMVIFCNVSMLFKINTCVLWSCPDLSFAYSCFTLGLVLQRNIVIFGIIYLVHIYDQECPEKFNTILS